ncbi:MAG TPA: helix-turn-helix transcriptional regulator, partial [Candidatus Aveggerthella stercoripullorum]|nr:helix-turn-helix transcriptional regulator [Candidatus Aveggerthella stercoripullorum]
MRNANAVGDNINAIRFDLGLSQDQLAKRVGVRQTTVSS